MPTPAPHLFPPGAPAHTCPRCQLPRRNTRVHLALEDLSVPDRTEPTRGPDQLTLPTQKRRRRGRART